MTDHGGTQDVRWGHPDQWQGRDSAEREAALRAERDHYRKALEQIGQMVGARANGADARAVARVARAALDEERRS